MSDIKAIQGPPLRDQITSVQITNLLNVVGVLFNALHAGKDDEPHIQKREIDGGALMAAEHTIVNACNALDSILSDERRWNIDVQESLEASLMKMYKANTQLAEAQHQHVKKSNSPSQRHRPTLLWMLDNLWAAVMGDLSLPEHLIVGTGASPEEAYEDFDKVFAGKKANSRDTVLKWIADKQQEADGEIEQTDKTNEHLDSKGS